MLSTVSLPTTWHRLACPMPCHHQPNLFMFVVDEQIAPIANVGIQVQRVSSAFSNRAKDSEGRIEKLCRGCLLFGRIRQDR